MLLKRGVAEDMYATASQRLRDKAKARLPEPQYPIVKGYTYREHVYKPIPSRDTETPDVCNTPCLRDDA
jgi:hypothetical protein